MQELVKKAIISFRDILIPINYEKGDLLIRENSSSKNIFLVEKGLLRSFYFVKGKDVTAYFANDYNIIGAIDSIIKDKNSIYNIEALENSFVYLLKYQEMENYLDHNPKLERLVRQISQFLYYDLVQRMESMTFLTAKERYDNLISKYPSILNKASLGHIASYLGITQETLSRVRSQR